MHHITAWNAVIFNFFLWNRIYYHPEASWFHPCRLICICNSPSKKLFHTNWVLSKPCESPFYLKVFLTITPLKKLKTNFIIFGVFQLNFLIRRFIGQFSVFQIDSSSPVFDSLQISLRFGLQFGLQFDFRWLDKGAIYFDFCSDKFS